MGRLVRLHDIDQFSRILHTPDTSVSPLILDNVRQLNEKTELEPAIRDILYDPGQTPHGPTEIADILTTKVVIRGEKRTTALILKGKSFQQVRSRDIAHQLMKVRPFPDLRLMVLLAVGHIQDDAQRDFIQTALDARCDYLVVDAHDCVRLLLAYEKICPLDGTPYNAEGVRKRGHQQDAGIKLEFQVREEPRYEIPRLQDVSHVGARRYSAVALIDRHYSKEVIREIIRSATERVRHSVYSRNAQVAAVWKDSPAHVVWLYLAVDLEDIRHTNWVCISQWIDPELERTVRPVSIRCDEQINGIGVAWSSDYQTMKDFYERHSGEKGEVLEQLQPLVTRSVEIGDQVERWLESYYRGQVSEQELIRLMQGVAEEVSKIYEASGNVPLPPDDLQDYEQVAQNIFAHLHNMCLYFTDQGLEQWSSAPRLALLTTSVQAFNRELERLRTETERIN
jgi:hypothetical protein